MCELISTKDLQTAPHVKLRSPQTYMQVATQHGLRLKRMRHVVSTYVAIQAVYGRFLARTAAVRTGQTTYNVKDDPQRNRSIGVLTKRVMRQLVSGFAKLADRVIVFLRIDDKFVGQDEIVFEKLLD